jgi:hypothetical protein
LAGVAAFNAGFFTSSSLLESDELESFFFAGVFWTGCFAAAGDLAGAGVSSSLLESDELDAFFLAAGVSLAAGVGNFLIGERDFLLLTGGASSSLGVLAEDVSSAGGGTFV